MAGCLTGIDTNDVEAFGNEERPAGADLGHLWIVRRIRDGGVPCERRATQVRCPQQELDSLVLEFTNIRKLGKESAGRIDALRQNQIGHFFVEVGELDSNASAEQGEVRAEL